MTISTYCGVPEDILDGIFSTEEMLRWKEIAETNKLINRKPRSYQSNENSLKQSYIIEIEPSQCCVEQNYQVLKKPSSPQLRLKLIQTALRKYTIYFLNECSYIPFLFMFSMTFLSMFLTGLPCVMASLSVCALIATSHLTYISFE